MPSFLPCAGHEVACLVGSRGDDCSDTLKTDEDGFVFMGPNVDALQRHRVTVVDNTQRTINAHAASLYGLQPGGLATTTEPPLGLSNQLR